MILDEVADLLTQTVTIEPYAGLGAHGESVYGGAVAYPARVWGKARRIRTGAGDEVTSTVQALLGVADAPVGVKDRITLPAGYQPAQPPILAVLRSPDEDGALVVEVFC